jgi:hypothetical protein
MSMSIMRYMLDGVSLPVYMRKTVVFVFYDKHTWRSVDFGWHFIIDAVTDSEYLQRELIIAIRILG